MIRLAVFLGALHFIASGFIIGTFVCPYMGWFLHLPVPVFPTILAVILMFLFQIHLVIYVPQLMNNNKKQWWRIVQIRIFALFPPTALFMGWMLIKALSYKYLVWLSGILCCLLLTLYTWIEYNENEFRGQFICSRQSQRIKNKWGNTIFDPGDYVKLNRNGTVVVGKEGNKRTYSLIEQKYLD